MNKFNLKEMQSDSDLSVYARTRDLEDKSYASASVYGCSSISTLLPLVTKRIEDTNKRIREGCIGKSFKEIHQFLDPIEPGAAAAIALKITFDKVFKLQR